MSVIRVDGRKPRLMLTPEEAAMALGIGRTKVYELIASEVLTSVKIGTARRVSVANLVDFVNALPAIPSSPEPWR